MKARDHSFSEGEEQTRENDKMHFAFVFSIWEKKQQKQQQQKQKGKKTENVYSLDTEQEIFLAAVLEELPDKNQS